MKNEPDFGFSVAYSAVVHAVVIALLVILALLKKNPETPLVMAPSAAAQSIDWQDTAEFLPGSAAELPEEAQVLLDSPVPQELPYANSSRPAEDPESRIALQLPPPDPAPQPEPPKPEPPQPEPPKPEPPKPEPPKPEPPKPEPPKPEPPKPEPPKPEPPKPEPPKPEPPQPEPPKPEPPKPEPPKPEPKPQVKKEIEVPKKVVPKKPEPKPKPKSEPKPKPKPKLVVQKTVPKPKPKPKVEPKKEAPKPKPKVEPKKEAPKPKPVVKKTVPRPAQKSAPQASKPVKVVSAPKPRSQPRKAKPVPEAKKVAQVLVAPKRAVPAGGSLQAGAGAPRARPVGGASPKAAAEYPWYDQLIKDTFESNWRGPQNLMGRTLFVKVKITVAPDGRVVEARFAKQSGVRSMDDSVIEALRATARIPKPLPGELASGNYSFLFTFKLTPTPNAH